MERGDRFSVLSRFEFKAVVVWGSRIVAATPQHRGQGRSTGRWNLKDIVVRFGARASAAVAASLVAAALAVPPASLASPMSYTATVVTDIKVGKYSYHNAAVSLTFVGDTNDITAAVDGSGNPIVSSYCGGTGWFYWLVKGSSSVTVESQGRSLTAHLVAGQIFVALDQCNGGIGFGSYVGPNGLEPAYPLAFTIGTAETAAYNTGLWSPSNMTGDAWSCIGYPPGGAGNLVGNGHCAAPDAYPLLSDLGEVFFYQPYFGIYTADGTVVSNHNGSLNRGTFAIRAVVNN